MLDSIYNHLLGVATWPVVVLLFIVLLFCMQGFDARAKKLGPKNPGLDGRGWYSPEQAREFFEAIEKRGRNLYAATEISLDLLFPLVYGTLLAAMIIHLYSPENARMLILVPLLTALADLAENFINAYLAWQFDGRASPITTIAATFTATKFVLGALSVLLLLIGAVKGLGRTQSPPG